MSTREIHDVIGKALRDADFRYRLFSEPEVVLEPFGLTQLEKEAIMRLDAETMEAFSEGRDRRDEQAEGEVDQPR